MILSLQELIVSAVLTRLFPTKDALVREDPISY